jgi:hypothetical protein
VGITRSYASEFLIIGELGEGLLLLLLLLLLLGTRDPLSF